MATKAKKPAKKPAKPAAAKPAAKAKKAPAPAPPPPPKKLPAVAVKPKRASKPSIPLPPPPPPPPAHRDEMEAPRDIARLLRYGERFGDKRIDIRMQQAISLPSSGTIAIYDPTNPKTAKTFDRPSGTGNFRVMLSVVLQDGKPEKLAALIVHVGRPPIAKWTVAHYAKDKKPKNEDSLPRVETKSGWIGLVDGSKAPASIDVPSVQGVTPASVKLPDGRDVLALPTGDGEFSAYWAVDATDKPICLVVDFDQLTQKDWKTKSPQ